MNDLDINYLSDLIKQAEQKTPSEKDPKVKKHLYRFINDYNIQNGVDKVPNYLIYYTYKVKWTKYKNERKMSKIEFFRQFNKMFTSSRIGKQRFYLLNQSSFDFSRETLMEAEFYDRKYQRTKKKKVKKIQSKTPQSESKI